MSKDAQLALRKIKELQFERLIELREFFLHNREASTKQGLESLRETVKILSFGVECGQKIEEDSRFRSALLEFLEAIEDRAGRPHVWRIAGGAVLLQEFVMPILAELQESVDIFEKLRSVTFETQDMGFQRGRLYNAVNKGEAKFVISNGRRIDTELKKFSKKDTPYRIYKFNSLKQNLEWNAKDQVEPEDDELENGKKKKKESNSILARVNVGSFDYKLYMQPQVFDKYRSQHEDEDNWWTKVPLVLAHHCPCGLRSLSEIAKAERANVVHECPGLASALCAIEARNSPFATILPTYFSKLENFKSIKIGNPSNYPKNELDENDPHELKEHFISILWKPNSVVIDETKKSESGKKKSEVISKNTQSGSAIITILNYLHSRTKAK